MVIDLEGHHHGVGHHEKGHHHEEDHHAHDHSHPHGHHHEHPHGHHEPHGHKCRQPHHHEHRNLHDIKNLIEASILAEAVKQKSLQIFSRLAEAEAQVHRTSIDQIHFHEVGAMDAIIDIVGAVVGFQALGIEKIYCSALHVGSGTVECAHGTLPVPAPATLDLIKGKPIQLYDYLIQKILDLGALDVFLTPIQMKKNRPGTLVSVICPVEAVERFADFLLQETTTIGLRWRVEDRLKAERSIRAVQGAECLVGVKLFNLLTEELGPFFLGKALVEKLGDFPQACWLFCPPQSHLPELLKGIVSAVRTRTLVGCTTDGEISCEGFSTGTAVLGGIVTDQIDFQVAQVTKLGQDSEEAGKELARALPPESSYVQLFSDGITGNGCALLRGLAAVLGRPIPISGGTAGDGGEFVRTWQFAGDQVLTDAAVAISFSGDFKVGTGVRSGWSPLGIATRVTRASGNVLYKLGGQPALEVYERFLGKHAERLPAVGVEYPLGLVDETGNCGGGDYYLLRATMSVNRQEGSITFAGEIPEGAMVRMTCGDTTAILDAASQAVPALYRLG